MDVSLVLGLLIGIGLLIGSIVVQGPLGAFLDLSSVMITIGGSIAALMVNFPLAELARIWAIFKIALANQEHDPHEIIETLVRFAEVSRREGLLALKNDLKSLMIHFSRRGFSL